MQKYRFVKFQNGEKWYAQSPYGAVAGLKRNQARLFDDDDWRLWGQRDNWIKEPLGEDQLMKLAGAPTLPGLEL